MTMSLSRGRKFLLCVISVLAVAIIVTVVQSKKQHESEYNGIPLPFSSPDSALTGSVSFLYKRNGIDVYDVTYAAGEISEILEEDKMYLVHIPNAPEILNVPLDIAMVATSSLGSDVDYYGYRYSDPSATLEKRDSNAPRFKDRFPASFFASAKALDNDASHGNNLHTFAEKNEIVFRPTDGSEGSVRIDPAGALYIFVVNESIGARLFARSGGVCGNGLQEPNEECDDGDQDNNNTCSNVCTKNIPLPFDGAHTTVNIVVQTVSLVGTVSAGDNDVSLMRFDVGTTDAATLNKVIVEAQIGTLDDAENYKLVADIDHDGVLDTVLQSDVVPVDGRLTFDALGENGLDVGSDATITLEILADIVAVPTQESLQLKLASSVEGYIQASAADEPLVGIMTNGVCVIDVCDITVETHPSVLLTITPATPVNLCGNGHTDENGADELAGTADDEECDDGDFQNGDGCSACQIDEGFICNTSVQPSQCEPDGV